MRRLTPWRNHLVNVASSFSPDGSLLALSRRTGAKPAWSVALRLDGSGSAVLARNGFAPRYSPDSSEVMFLRGHRRTFRELRREGHTRVESTTTTTVTDIFAMKTDGSGLRRITHTPRLSESPVSWDPSGERIVYVAESVGPNDFLPFGDRIIEANAEGSCETPVLTDPEFAYFGAAWQPGPGRAVGRISC